MSNIYLGFNVHGLPVRVSREVARKMYKKATGLEKRIDEIIDGEPAMYMDNISIFLIVCDEVVKDEEAVIYEVDNKPVLATELPD